MRYTTGKGPWNARWTGRIIMLSLLALVSFLMISTFSCAKDAPKYLKESDLLFNGVDFCMRDALERPFQADFTCVTTATWKETQDVLTECREVLKR